VRKPTKIIFEYEGPEAAALYEELTSAKSSNTTTAAQIEIQVPIASKETKTRVVKKQVTPAPSDVTLQTITQQFVKLANAQGHQRALEILKQFDAKSVPTLKPEKFAEVSATLQKALESS
jgi:DNA-directed RNA polymerase specialized sigma54-like protein